jgi:hypothetical protein
MPGRVSADTGRLESSWGAGPCQMHMTEGGTVSLHMGACWSQCHGYTRKDLDSVVMAT